jgi:hypothetical protein
MINIKQIPDGSMGLEGKDLNNGQFIPVIVPVNAASPATQVIFTADRALVLQGMRYRPEVAGTGGACTFVVNKSASGTAISAGTAVHSGSFNVAGTAATNQVGTLSATTGVTALAAGDSLGIIITGTATSAVGALSLWFNPA